MAISIGDALLKLGVDTKDLEKGLQGVGATIKKHQKAIGIGMTAAGGVILAGLGVSLKAAVNFEGAMREVNTMMGLSQDEFKLFSDGVLALSSDLGVDAVGSAEALYQAISAGIPKENVLEFLKIATELAIGGVADTTVAVDGLTTIIKAFKLPMGDAQKVADAMFTAVEGGKTTLDELSASIGMVAPAAAAMGVEFDTVLAALATMTTQGIDTARATTSLNAVMTALMKPTSEMRAALDELGFSSADAMIEEVGLAEALALLTEQAGGSKEMLGKMFGSTEAMKAIFALTGDSAFLFAENLDAMTDAQGAATDAFIEMEESATRQMEALKASAKGVMITVGNVLIPVLKDLLDMIKPIIESVKNWMEANPGLTRAIVIGAAAIGSLLVVLGPLLIMLPGIIAFLPILGAAFTLMLGPVGLVILGIAALIAIGVLLVKNWDWIKEKTIAVWTGIKMFFIGLWASIMDLFKTKIGMILAVLFPFLGIPLLLIANWGTIIGFFKGLLGTVKSIFANIGKAMWEPIKTAVDAIMRYVQGIIDAITRLWGFVGRLTGRGGAAPAPTTAPGVVRGPDLGPGGLPFGPLQQGGIIMRPMLAKIAERQPEAVIPLDRLGEMLGGGRTVNIYVELDGRTIAKAIGQPLVEEIRLRTGMRI